MRSYPASSIAMLAAVCLFSSGFILAQPASAPAGMPNPKAPAGAKVFIVSPQDGATVGADVVVKFGVEGIGLAPAANATPNSGHHHLLIDAVLPPLNEPIPNDATRKHYGKAQTEDTIHLSPGDHTLQLDYGDALHMQFDPPLVSKKITVHVK